MRIASLVFALMIPQVVVAQSGSALPGHATVFATNVAIGGLTAGIGRALGKKPFLKQMLRGSAGGGVVFAGKMMAGRNDSFTAFLGRSVGAIGASEVRNASTGRGLLQEIVLPIGPLHIYVERKTWARRVKLDLSTVLVSGYLALQADASFKPGESVLRGVMFFENPGASTDFQAAGAVSIRELHSPDWEAQISRGIGHELVHVVQSDFMAIAWSEPAESWILSHVPGGKKLNKYVALGIMNPIWAGVNGRLSIWERPWETEARLLSQ